MIELPLSIDAVNYREWKTFEPYYTELIERELSAETQQEWLQDWSDLTRFWYEVQAYTSIQRTLDTSDAAREAAYLDVVKSVLPHVEKAEQALKQRMLQLEIDDADMQIALRNLRDEVDLFCEGNLPLKAELVQLSTQYDKLAGGLSAEWDGETKNLNQLAVHLDSPDRAERERGWHTVMGLWQSIQSEANDIYVQMLAKRHQMAQNAGLDNHRQYAFRTRRRFSYTAEDCYQFHEAIEAAFVPAVERIFERKRKALGYDKLRPWEWVPEMGKVVSTKDEPLTPFSTEEQLTQHSLDIFHSLDPELGYQFSQMAEGGMLDLMTRQGKAMGAYSHSLPYRRLPFIFMNAVGSGRNVQTMLHEAGHAFHSYTAMRSQPLVWQMRAPMEFNEVASMGMEMLAAPNLTKERGGFYTEAEAARHRVEHLEKTLIFFPYMAVVDAFQHWVYTNIDAASDPDNLDAKYDELAQRFLRGIDWTGLEAIRATGWQRKLHIFRYPFYYIEYGMAQVGAYQVFRNSLDDHAQALADYRAALALGGTKTLPQLFNAAGAEFRFDTPFLTELVEFVENEIAQLRATE